MLWIIVNGVKLELPLPRRTLRRRVRVANYKSVRVYGHNWQSATHALSHPFVERMIGTIQRECLDHVPFSSGMLVI